MEDRKTYISKMAAKLQEWDANIKNLEAKAAAANAGVKAQVRQQLEELHKRKNEARQKLEKIQGAGEGAWQDLKGGIEQSWKTLGDSIRTATDKLNLSEGKGPGITEKSKKSTKVLHD